MASEIKVNTIKDLGGNTVLTSNGSGTISGLPASAISSGTVATARLGSGTASSSTFLAGDSSYKTVSGTTINNNADNRVITGSGTANTLNGEQFLTYNGTILGVGADGNNADLGQGIHIKASDSGGSAAANEADFLIIEKNSDVGMQFLSSTSGTANIYFGDSGDNNIGKIQYSHGSNVMYFTTNASEAMRINSSGDVSVGSTATTAKFNVATTGGSGYFHNTGSSFGANNLQSAVNRFTANNSYRFFYCVNSDNVKMQVIDSGAVQNAPNSYGGISDERTKQDITDASSQWEDIKALKVRKYKLKCDVALDGKNAQSQIGVVSQELEASGMSGLVLESDSTAQDVKLHSDFGTLEDGTADNGAEPIKDEDGNITGYEKLFTKGQKVKAVKYSVLYMKAIKCLQEAQIKIETLETENTDIKARLTALESA